MDHQQAVTSMSKYVAQAKEFIEIYLKQHKNFDTWEIEEALKLLNIALENVVI